MRLKRAGSIVVAGLTLTMLGATSAWAQSVPPGPPPAPPVLPPSTPATLPVDTPPSAAAPVTEVSPAPVSIVRAAVNGRKLLLTLQCQRGVPGTMTLLEGGQSADKAYGTVRYGCTTGRLNAIFTMPLWMTRQLTSTRYGAPAAVRVNVSGRSIPVLFSLRLRLPAAGRGAIAHAAATWAYNPDLISTGCWAGALYGDYGSLAINPHSSTPFGAANGELVQWRAYAWTGRGWLWGRLRSYIYHPINNPGGNVVINGVVYTILGSGGATGVDVTPETILVAPGTWVRPALGVTVPARGINAFNFTYVTEHSVASFSPGVAVYPTGGRPEWCGFGV
jgi:hypothetical protein